MGSNSPSVFWYFPGLLMAGVIRSRFQRQVGVLVFWLHFVFALFLYILFVGEKTIGQARI